MEIPTGTYTLRKSGKLPDKSFEVGYSYIYCLNYDDFSRIVKHHRAQMVERGYEDIKITCDMKLYSQGFSL